MSFDSLTLETGGYLTLEDGISHLLLEIFPVYAPRGGGSAFARKLKPRSREFQNWSPNPIRDPFQRTEPQVIPVDSSIIASIAHDPNSRTMQVGFKTEGRFPDIYRYHGVTEQSANRVISAAKSPTRSVGKAVNQVLIGKHPYIKK